jgi:hypothetical protein
MKKLIFLLLLLPTLVYPQAKVKTTCFASIINLNDTAKYNIEQLKIVDKAELIVKEGDTKEYLRFTFYAPDNKILMPNDKEKWVYGSLAVYINKGVVEITQVIKNLK